MDVEPIKTTVDELLKVLATENVIGETIETEDKIIIPVTKFGMAFGAASAEGSALKDQSGKGSGAGGGAGIEPIAMVVVFKGMEGPESVRVMHLTKPSPMGRAVSEAMPAVIDLMKEGKETVKEMREKKEEEKEEKEESE